MRKAVAVACAGVMLGVTACDPATEDDRGYTKAPLERPGLFVGAEEPMEMDELGDPIDLVPYEATQPPQPQPQAAPGAAGAQPVQLQAADSAAVR